MRPWPVFVLVLVALPACSEQLPVGDLSDFYGRWVLTAVSAQKLPPACSTAAYEITPTTITAFTGQLEISASYEAVRTAEGLTFRQHDLRHNGNANCQGIPAEYVVDHFVMNLELDLVDGLLRIYLPSRASGQYLELERDDL